MAQRLLELLEKVQGQEERIGGGGGLIVMANAQLAARGGRDKGNQTISRCERTAVESKDGGME